MWRCYTNYLFSKLNLKKTDLKSNYVEKGKTDYVTVAGRMTKDKVHPRTASHKSNSSSVPRGIVDSYSTLGHVGGVNICGGHSLMRVAPSHAGKRGSGLPKPRWKVSC